MPFFSDPFVTWSQAGWKRYGAEKEGSQCPQFMARGGGVLQSKSSVLKR